MPRRTRVRPALALDAQENALLLDTLNSERFADTAPAAVHAALLDEGRYLCSVRTMHRLLNTRGSSRERRRQLTHPTYVKPELLAVAPNQVWSWEITKLKGPAKWTCFHLYVILDIFSRHVVGWLIAERESADLAEQLIADSVSCHDVQRGTLTLHADRGAAMRSKPALFAGYGSLDQPAGIGEKRPEKEPVLHSKFMTTGPAKSLTRSGSQA